MEIEVVCSDAAEHRRWVETRASDLPGLVPPTWELVPPTWEAVSRRGYEPWTEPRFVLDTAALRAEDAASRGCAELASRGQRR